MYRFFHYRFRFRNSHRICQTCKEAKELAFVRHRLWRKVPSMAFCRAQRTARGRRAWRRELLWLQSDEFSDVGNPVSQVPVRAVIERQLQQMGFNFVGDSGSADYVVLAVVVLGESKKGQAFEELAQMYPSLEYLSETMEKGTLTMALARPSSPLILWRSGLEAFIAEDISAEQRRQRLHSVVRMLLGTLPLEPV